MRSWLRRSAGVPDEVSAAAAAAGMDPREQVLAQARAEDGTWLLGTRRALTVVPDGGVAEVVPWEQVQRADWAQDSAVLTVRRVPQDDHADPVVTTHPLDEPTEFLMLLRERVTASMLLQHRVRIDGRKGVTVVARRSPSGAGPVKMTWELDAGLDPHDPGVWGVVEGAVRDAQDMLGMP